MSIRMLSEEEKSQSIQYILEQAMPERNGSEILSMLRIIGFRNLFAGVADCVFLAVMGGIVFVIAFLAIPYRYQNFLGIDLFCVSPFLYSLLYFLSAWKEKQNALYSIKMTCHYTLREMTALRMIFFGGISTLLDMVLLYGLQWKHSWELSPLQMMAFSLSALFLYGSLMIVLLKSRFQKVGTLVLPLLWLLLCLLLMIGGSPVSVILVKVPEGVSIAFACLLLVNYIYQTERFLRKEEEGSYYAVY